MSDLREYEVNGCTYLLSKEDAERLGAKPVEPKQATKPAEKSARTTRAKK